MKKINLILCACAVALSGLMVSCKNGNVDIINVTETTTNYIYKINGTVTTTDTYGTGTAVSTDVSTYTIKDANTGRIQVKEDEQMEGNAKWYSFNTNGGSVSATSTVTSASGVKTDYVLDVASINGLVPNGFEEIDGDYYMVLQWAYVNVDDAFDGFIGDDEFTFKYTTAAVDNQSWTQAEVDAKEVNNSSTTYDLTFTLVGEE